MDVKELRIGNYINDNDNWDWENGVDLPDLIICVDSHLLIYQGNNFQPIPLTEDWLLKLKFEEKDRRKNRFINRADFELEFQGDKVAYCVWGGEDAPHLTQFFGHCKYVHQLQNLYFALTGKELTI